MLLLLYRSTIYLLVYQAALRELGWNLIRLCNNQVLHLHDLQDCLLNAVGRDPEHVQQFRALARARDAGHRQVLHNDVALASHSRQHGLAETPCQLMHVPFR